MFRLIRRCRSLAPLIRGKTVADSSPLVCGSRLLCSPATTPGKTRNDYLQVLGLPENATPADIKAAYYHLSLRLHPDRNDGSEEANAHFQTVLEAYERLNELARSHLDDPNSSAIEGKIPMWATNSDHIDNILKASREGVKEFLQHTRVDPNLAGDDNSPEAIDNNRRLTWQLLNCGALAVMMLGVIQFVSHLERRNNGQELAPVDVVP